MNNSGFILAGWLIDGSGRSVQRNRVLHIKNGYIDFIKKAEKDGFNRAELLDFSDSTILPGLVDSHVHLSMSATNNQQDRKYQLVAGFDYIKDLISSHIKQHFLSGVLAVRDGGDNKEHVLRYKTGHLNYKNTPISLKVAGSAWHKPGRYGKLIGRSPSGNDSIAQAIAKENKKIDHIKIVNSGLNSLTLFGKETLPQFKKEELRKVVELAQIRGLKVMVHANGKKPVKIAVDSGCHSIEHGFFMGREVLKQMADNNVVWVPTACTMNAYSQFLKSTSIEADVARKNLDHQLEQIFQARESGVPIALGTDSGSLGVEHGKAVIEELKLLIRAGFPIQEAIKSATLNGARLLGLTNTGLLAEKMPATFLVVRGTPSDLPDSLNRIKTIYINGVHFNPLG